MLHDRESLFYFVDKNNKRPFDKNNKYELSIIKYFKNYNKFNTNKLRSTYNTPSSNIPTPSYINDDNEIITIIKELLLLQSSTSSNPFIYTSKYDDINDIKSNIIDIYNNIINPNNIKYNID